jgi:ubiquinone/menaquinone biosynthesis C-methylase UbiE
MWNDVFDLAADTYDEPPLRFFDHQADRLVRAAGLRAGERVLDVATGTGKVAVRAARLVDPGGSVTGVDLSVAMLARARERTAGLPASFARMDARRLAFPDSAFDVVLCGFGISFMRPDPSVAAREMLRTLVPGGRVLLSTPHREAFLPPLRVFLDALGRRSTDGRAGRRTRDWRAVDRARHLRIVLRRSGFRRVRVTRVEVGYTLDDAEEFWTILRGSAWRSVLARLPPAVLDEVRGEVMAGVEALRGNDGIPLRVPVLLASAERPRGRTA